MNQTHKKIGGFTTFAMLVGSVVGIGIFLKNNTIFKNTDYNPTTTIVAWAIAAIVCLFLSISYSRISTMTQSRAGIAGWIDKLGYKKFSRFVSFSFPVFYFGLLLPGISYFVAELLLSIVDQAAGTKLLSDQLGQYSTIALIVAIGFVLYVAFLGLNYYSLSASGWVAKISLVLKFIPLIAVVVMGVLVTVMVSWSASTSLFKGGVEFAAGRTNQVTLTLKSFNVILIALPAILFSFDSFINVGSLAPDVKNASKTMPRVVVAGMIVIAITYLLITAAQIQLGSGIAWEAFNDEKILQKLGLAPAVAKQVYLGLKITVITLIFVSAIGVLNGMSATAINNAIFIIEKRMFVFAGALLRLTKNNLRLAGTLALFGFNMVWSVLYLGTSFWSNSDAFIDGLTNFPTLFFFVIFGLVPMMWIFRRIKYCEKFSFKFVVEIIIAFIGFVGSWVIVFYQLIYVFFFDAFLNINATFDIWGGFAETKSNFTLFKWHAATVFLGSFALFLLLPFINFAVLSMLNWLKYRKYYDITLLANEDARKLAESKVQFYAEHGGPGEVGATKVLAPPMRPEQHMKNTAFLVDNDNEPLNIVLKKERNIRLAREEYLRKIRSSSF